MKVSSGYEPSTCLSRTKVTLSSSGNLSRDSASRLSQMLSTSRGQLLGSDRLCITATVTQHTPAPDSRNWPSSRAHVCANSFQRLSCCPLRSTLPRGAFGFVGELRRIVHRSAEEESGRRRLADSANRKQRHTWCRTDCSSTCCVRRCWDR